MSQRDRRLLEEAGISIVQAADLFERSRQALYTGLAHERDYFSPEDVLKILVDARSRDFGGLGKLIQFVEGSYSDHRDVLVPERIAFAQLSHVLKDAQRVVMTTNGNQDHFLPESNFLKVYSDLLDRDSLAYELLVPGEWVLHYMRQHPMLEDKIDEAHIKVRTELAYWPSFILIELKSQRRRAFMFGRVGVEEVLPREADMLWQHFAQEHAAEAKSGDRHRRRSAKP